MYNICMLGVEYLLSSQHYYQPEPTELYGAFLCYINNFMLFRDNYSNYHFEELAMENEDYLETVSCNPSIRSTYVRYDGCSGP